MKSHGLLIGIDDYPGFGPEAQLRGATKDVMAFARLLIDDWGFAESELIYRLNREATRSGILDGFEILLSRLGKHDRVVLFFSGHGSQMTDREGDEGDGLDETLVPFDSGRVEDENRDISDDEIHLWAARVLEKTSHLLLVFDCCHAGTLHRPLWRVRSVPADLRPVHLLPPSPITTKREVEVARPPIRLAACGDHGLAHELPAYLIGENRGVFSYHLVEELRAVAPSESWRQLFARVEERVQKQCRDQRPEISGDRLDLPPFVASRQKLRSTKQNSVARLLDLAQSETPPGWRFDLLFSRRGPWQRLATSGLQVGDCLRIDLSHRNRLPLFVYLLDIGVTSQIQIVFPESDGHEALDPELTLSIGDLRGRELELFKPDARKNVLEEVSCHLVLVASRVRLSAFELLNASWAVEPLILIRSYQFRS